MNRFRTRQGVFLVELKGTYLLVCNHEARKHCVYVRRINETGAFLWNMVQDGLSFEEMLSLFMAKYDIEDPESVKRDIRAYIKQLEEKGYIFVDEPGGENFD